MTRLFTQGWESPSWSGVIRPGRFPRIAHVMMLTVLLWLPALCQGGVGDSSRAGGVLAGLGTTLELQELEPSRTPVAAPERPLEPSSDDRRPTHAFELAYSQESVWAAYRGRFSEGRGHATLGWLGNEDDDGTLLLRVMRFGEPRRAVPFGLGVGLGVYGGSLEDPDTDFFAVALAGHADYAFDTPWPLRLMGEVSFAPDIATSSDADDLIDILARLEVELSDFAGAYVGARLLEVGLESGGRRELDSSVHVGIRLWF